MNADDKSSSVRFARSTVIVKYLQTQTRNYDNHKNVMKELYLKRAYPTMRQYFLKKTAHEGKYGFLIVKTGSLEEFLRKASISELKEAIETVIPGGAFTDIHGDGNVADTAEPGEVIVSMTEFECLRTAIEEGAFSIEEVLEYDNSDVVTPPTKARLIDTRLVGSDKIDADPSILGAKDSKGYTPLHWAASDGRLREVELYVGRGAEIDAVDGQGSTPLHRAIENSPTGRNHKDSDRTGIVTLLISKGANVKATEEDGYTPLHIAAFVAQEDYISLLLEKGADVQARSRDGFTPLHSAAMSGYQSVADLLISRGADVLSKTNNGKSVADAADDRAHSPLARYLRAAQKVAEKRLHPWWKVW